MQHLTRTTVPQDEMILRYVCRVCIFFVSLFYFVCVAAFGESSSSRLLDDVGSFAIFVVFLTISHPQNHFVYVCRDVWVIIFLLDVYLTNLNWVSRWKEPDHFSDEEKFQKKMKAMWNSFYSTCVFWAVFLPWINFYLILYLSIHTCHKNCIWLYVVWAVASRFRQKNKHEDPKQDWGRSQRASWKTNINPQMRWMMNRNKTQPDCEKYQKLLDVDECYSFTRFTFLVGCSHANHMPLISSSLFLSLTYTHTHFLWRY